MRHLIPGIPRARQQHPQQPESVGESRSRLILLLDPTLAHSQLAFCGQYSCCQSGLRAKKSPEKSAYVSGTFPEIRNRPEGGPKQRMDDAHGPQNTGPQIPTQGLRKSLLNKADDIFRGDTQKKSLIGTRSGSSCRSAVFIRSSLCKVFSRRVLIWFKLVCNNICDSVVSLSVSRILSDAFIDCRIFLISCVSLAPV